MLWFLEEMHQFKQICLIKVMYMTSRQWHIWEWRWCWRRWQGRHRRWVGISLNIISVYYNNHIFLLECHPVKTLQHLFLLHILIIDISITFSRILAMNQLSLVLFFTNQYLPEIGMMKLCSFVWFCKSYPVFSSGQVRQNISEMKNWRGWEN